MYGLVVGENEVKEDEHVHGLSGGWDLKKHLISERSESSSLKHSNNLTTAYSSQLWRGSGLSSPHDLVLLSRLSRVHCNIQLVI